MFRYLTLSSIIWILEFGKNRCLAVACGVLRPIIYTREGGFRKELNQSLSDVEDLDCHLRDTASLEEMNFGNKMSVNNENSKPRRGSGKRVKDSNTIGVRSIYVTELPVKDGAAWAEKELAVVDILQWVWQRCGWCEASSNDIVHSRS